MTMMTSNSSNNNKNKKMLYAGIPIAAVAIAGLFMLPLTSAMATWEGVEGCTPGYWKNHADTNRRVAQLYGINLNAAVLDITGLNLGAPASLTIDKAVSTGGGGTTAFYRHLAAGVFNYYYADPTAGNNINYIDPATFKAAVQMALGGNVSGATRMLDAANNLGCPIDSFGNWK